MSWGHTTVYPELRGRRVLLRPLVVSDFDAWREVRERRERRSHGCIDTDRSDELRAAVNDAVAYCIGVDRAVVERGSKRAIDDPRLLAGSDHRQLEAARAGVYDQHAHY